MALVAFNSLKFALAPVNVAGSVPRHVPVGEAGLPIVALGEGSEAGVEEGTRLGEETRAGRGVAVLDRRGTPGLSFN